MTVRKQSLTAAKTELKSKMRHHRIVDLQQHPLTITLMG